MKIFFLVLQIFLSLIVCFAIASSLSIPARTPEMDLKILQRRYDHLKQTSRANEDTLSKLRKGYELLKKPTLKVKFRDLTLGRRRKRGVASSQVKNGLCSWRWVPDTEIKTNTNKKIMKAQLSCGGACLSYCKAKNYVITYLVKRKKTERLSKMTVYKVKNKKIPIAFVDIRSKRR